MPTKLKSKLTPHYILGEDFIVVTHNGKPYTIYQGDARFHNLRKVISKGAWTQLESALNAAKTIEKYGVGKVKVFENEIHYDGKPVHNSVTKRVFEFISQDYPFEHLVKFLDKLMLNPSERSREQLFGYLERYNLAINEDGDFLAFKSVTDRFLDHHTQTIDNSVGKIVKVPRNKVSDDANCACHFGLHVGAFTYVSSFGGSGSVIILVKVNPQNVISIPNDANCAKMRVCEYKVVGIAGEAENVEDFTSNHVKGNSVTKNIQDSTIMGANRAYEIHRKGEISLQGEDSFGKVVIVNTLDKKPRSFFRQYKNWQVAKETGVIPTNGVKVGSNRAYELHKQGADLQSLSAGLVKKGDGKSRKFFRQYNDWYQV